MRCQVGGFFNQKEQAMRKSLFLKLVLLGCILLLLGCAHEPTVVVRTTLVTPPDNLLLDCSVAAPPSREAYKAAGEGVSHEQAAEVREKMLMEHAGTQMKNLSVCNTNMQQLRDWKTKQQQLYKTPVTQQGG